MGGFERWLFVQVDGRSFWTRQEREGNRKPCFRIPVCFSTFQAELENFIPFFSLQTIFFSALGADLIQGGNEEAKNRTRRSWAFVRVP